jgi:hypothetical protein
LSDAEKSERTAANAPAEPGERAAAAGCPALDDAVREIQAMRWRYNLAQAEIGRLRGALSSTEDARDEQDQRRSALIEAVADSVPSAMLTSRRQGWDEGWEAAQAGFPKNMNPHRGQVGPPAAAED